MHIGQTGPETLPPPARSGHGPGMGVFTRLLTPAGHDGRPEVAASAGTLATGWWPGTLEFPQLAAIGQATRAQAMQVPTIARARNLLAGTIAELPLEAWTASGDAAPPLPWHGQPDSHAPRAVTLAWTIDDLLFHGYAYWQVTAVYADDGRPMRMHRLNPARVTEQIGPDGWTIVGLTVDGRPAPHTGVGRVVMFQGLDEGLLTRAGTTILTALALERAAKRYADEPLPASVLKNKGAELSRSKIDELLDRWKAARRDGSVGYLNADIDLDRVGWSAGELQLVEAREHLSVELARACNVPAWYVGADTGTSMTYSNLTSQRRDLIDYSMRPFLSAVEQRLTMADVTPGPTVIRFGLDDFLRGDPRERAEVWSMLIAADVIDADEARAREGLTPRGTDPDPEPDNG